MKQQENYISVWSVQMFGIMEDSIKQLAAAAGRNILHSEPLVTESAKHGMSCGANFTYFGDLEDLEDLHLGFNSHHRTGQRTWTGLIHRLMVRRKNTKNKRSMSCNKAISVI